MVYDFILFENWHQATNHLKDVGIVASMLQDCGYSVAVADVYNSINESFIEGMPRIVSHHSVSFWYPPQSGILSFWLFCKIIGAINQVKEAWHLKKVMKELKGKYKHLYCGSYYVKMPIGWLRMIPSNSLAFFWGLRSARLVQYKKNAFSVGGISSFFLRKYFDKHHNLKFFVSDKLIYDEFITLGISPNRLIIRPERYIDDYPNSTRDHDKPFTLLSIGSLRPEKRIERILAALRQLGDKDVHYVIAGVTRPEYEGVIEAEIAKNKSESIERLNYRLSEDEFNQLINQSDFLVLCDRQQTSNVTNGTMNEALLAGVPIIAPNYNPYKYFIEKYGVGILFDPEESESLARAIRDAKAKRRDAYADAIHKYQSQYLKKVVVKEFGKSLQTVLE